MASTHQVVVVGAGIAGLEAARELTARGLSVRVLEQGEAVGGRMATRVRGERRWDHGAQFFTTRSQQFSETVDDAVAAGSVVQWCDGFGDPPDGFPRWRGAEAMTDLCGWLARDLAVELGVTVTDLREHPADAYVLTAPVPQSLAILSFSQLLPSPPLATQLAGIAYKPTIAVLFSIDGSSGLTDHGGVQLTDDPDLAFITDNQMKGISEAGALTVHLSNDRSAGMWSMSDSDIVARTTSLIRPHVGDLTVVDVQVQRWRYAGPVEVWPDPTVTWGESPMIALAGEAFAGPKVEGAFMSGHAAARHIADTLSV